MPLPLFVPLSDANSLPGSLVDAGLVSAAELKSFALETRSPLNNMSSEGVGTLGTRSPLNSM